MELINAIRGRRSVRSFEPEAPSNATIERLIDAAIHAPSAVNRQSWRFTVVRSKTLLDEISRDSKAYMTRARPIPVPEHLYDKLADPAFHVFYRAPALIVISGPANEPWIAEDCALAAENLMLAAYGLGLGSCWIGLAQPWLKTSEGKRSIGLPDAYTPLAPIVVGRPKEAPAPVPRIAPEINWVE